MTDFQAAYYEADLKNILPSVLSGISQVERMMRLHRVLGEFQKRAVGLACEIIEELTIHEDARGISPVVEGKFNEYFNAHPHIDQQHF